MKGDKKVKEEFILNCKKNSKIFKEYEKKCSDWKKIHSLYFKIAKENTTLEKAINYFVEICKILINSMKSGRISFEKGGFVESSFDKLPFLYTGEVYNFFDGELYGIAELFSHLKDKEDLKNLKKEFEVFTKKYGF